MPINQLVIENFKGIKERHTFKIRPLTIFCGPNSSGKSSVIHCTGSDIFEVVLSRRFFAPYAGAPSGNQGIAWVGPALMLTTLVWVSGIPFTEAQALRSRGDDYRQYQRSTSMLIPWFPKASA